MWTLPSFTIASLLSLALAWTSDANAAPRPAEIDNVYIQSGADGKSWVIGNALVERKVSFSHERGLGTTSWLHKVTNTQFLKPPTQETPNSSSFAAEFSFQADGQLYAGSSPVFNLLRAEAPREIPRGGRMLELKLLARQAPLEVSVFYAVYPGHPVIRKWVSVTNHGERAVILSNFAFESVPLEAALPSEQLVSAYYGIAPRESFFTGRAEDPAIVAVNPRTREGFLVMNEAPGWMKRTETNGWAEGIRVMYDTDIFPFERTVQPGETFTSAKSGIAFFQEGNGLSDPHWVLPFYTGQILMKKGSTYRPRWIYNTWEPFFQDYNETIVRELIPIASRMGFDVFTLDTGWSDTYENDEFNPKKFPDGIAGIEATLKQGGMRLGMWVPLAVTSKKGSNYRDHPEWVVRDARGNMKAQDFPSSDFVVMCLGSAYRDSAAHRINSLIKKHQLDYVKVDLTTVFNAYGLEPGCYAKGHDHQTWAESLGRIYEGIQYVTDAIYREHPEVLLDLTFELWGQKHVIDYGLLAAGDLDWLSNVTDASETSSGPRQVRTLLYHRALAIPVETMLIGNLRATTPTPEEHFATLIGSSPVLLGDLRKLSPELVDWYSQKIRWYKELRDSIPLWESFWPLGEWRQPSPVAWDGFARLSRQGEGLIVLFKNDSGLKSIQLKLPAHPDGEFHFRSVIANRPVLTYSGSDLRRGIMVALPENHKVEILEIRSKVGRQ
jgi:alpha-galactosidase